MWEKESGAKWNWKRPGSVFNTANKVKFVKSSFKNCAKVFEAESSEVSFWWIASEIVLIDSVNCDKRKTLSSILEKVFRGIHVYEISLWTEPTKIRKNCPLKLKLSFLILLIG